MKKKYENINLFIYVTNPFTVCLIVCMCECVSVSNVGVKHFMLQFYCMKNAI